jgi:hypothetical protein
MIKESLPIVLIFILQIPFQKALAVESSNHFTALAISPNFHIL